MVVAIEGVISKKEPTFVVIKCASGVSYGVFVSLFCSSSLNLGSKTELLITQIIKEDSNKFFGFLDKNEQIMFESLLKVNGVGTSTAMAVCSTLTVNDFYKALGSNDESVLKKVPGIGAKSAKRIIIELGDKKLNLAQGDELNSQALAALLSLGFKQDKILQTLATCESKELSTLIKEALKKLS